MGLSYDYLFTGNTSIGVSGNSHNIMKTWKDIEKQVDEVLAFVLDELQHTTNEDPDWMFNYKLKLMIDAREKINTIIRSTLDEYVRELIGEEELLVTDGDCPACGWHISAHGGEDGEKCPIIERNNFRRELLQQHEVQMGEKDD